MLLKLNSDIEVNILKIFCFDFGWQYNKSQFLADHKYAEFGTRELKGKIFNKTCSRFFLMF